MNKSVKIIGSVVGLVVLVLLTAILAFFLGGFKQDTETSAQVMPHCVPPSTNLTKPEILQSRPTPARSGPLPTIAIAPQLQRGARVSPPTLVMALDNNARIGLTSLQGNRAAVSIINAEGWTCLFLSDITTGRSEQVATLNGSLVELTMSDRYLVWVDQTVTPGETSSACTPLAPAPAPGTPRQPPAQPCKNKPPQYQDTLHIYDTQARQEIDKKNGTYRFPSASGDVLVWQNYNGIYGQDIATKQMFTVTTTSAGNPKVSGLWIAYFVPQNGPNQMLAGDLHLFNRQTNEDKVLGTVSAQVDGEGYAIDETWLAWMKTDLKQAVPIYELDVYSLATGTNRKIEIGNNVYPDQLLLSDGLLVYAQAGWRAVDLNTNTQFDVFGSKAALASIMSLKVSNNRLLWKMQDPVSHGVQLFTAQTSRPDLNTPHP